jgi:hypothetical protein
MALIDSCELGLSANRIKAYKGAEKRKLVLLSLLANFRNRSRLIDRASTDMFAPSSTYVDYRLFDPE